MSKVIHVAGKRKRAIARATIHEGKGIIRINIQILETYEPKMGRLRLMEPVLLSGDVAKKVNIDVEVHGGGWQGQTEAVRLTIARGLVQFARSKQLKQEFLEYDRNLLVQDSRHGEPSKPNDSKPRKARQKSYR